ncbi:MAG TPA: pirin family protein [archaeon]|nr:pirin family protein [archaeon]
MAIDIQRSNERGHSDHGWLSSNFSFSFADYYNPKRMGFGTLRVLNDDIIAPGRGFDMHPHENMEIVTIVLSGALEHRDSMGSHGVIKPGDVQHMSAGSGIVHSEFNPSKLESTSLLQIWVYPKEQDIEPTYSQKAFSQKDMKNKLLEVVGQESKKALYIRQNASFYLSELESSKKVVADSKSPGHGFYLFVIEGSVATLGKELQKRDAAQITNEKKLEISALTNSKILLIEVPLK